MYSLLTRMGRGSSLKSSLEDLECGLSLRSPHLASLEIGIHLHDNWQCLLSTYYTRHCVECLTYIISFSLHRKVRVVNIVASSI